MTRKKGTTGEGFSEEERAAMKERAREVRAQAKQRKGERGANGDAEILDKIAEMPKPDRELARKVHEIVRGAAPELEPRTWYGMPAYARAGKVVCFFQAAAKFKARYATLGFSDSAALDEGPMWPTSFALAELTPEVEARIVELVTRACVARST
jgi:uncharacterized protein YdhG (YjbR/CyaY superfamily)